jgi:hypothetical protein
MSSVGDKHVDTLPPQAWHGMPMDGLRGSITSPYGLAPYVDDSELKMVQKLMKDKLLSRLAGVKDKQALLEEKMKPTIRDIEQRWNSPTDSHFDEYEWTDTVYVDSQGSVSWEFNDAGQIVATVCDFECVVASSLLDFACRWSFECAIQNKLMQSKQLTSEEELYLQLTSYIQPV